MEHPDDDCRRRRNNIVFQLFHSPSVVYNPRAEAPACRYNMLGCGRVSGPGYDAAHSADGLHWNLYPENPVLSSSDTCTLALDPATGEYLAFHKRTHKHRGQSRRLVYLATSRDMQQWSEPKLVLAPDEIDDAQVRAEGGRFAQFCNMSAFPYVGQELWLYYAAITTTHGGYVPNKKPVRWKEHDRLNTAGPLRLRFHLRNARLFSFAVLARLWAFVSASLHLPCLVSQASSGSRVSHGPASASS